MQRRYLTIESPATGVEKSHRELVHLLPDFPAAIVRGFSATARQVIYEPGEVVFRAGARGDPGVVVTGLMRQSVRWHNGRLATLRYVRMGDLVGIASLFGPMTVTVTAVDRTTFVHFDLETMRLLASRQPQFALCLARVLSGMAKEMVNSATNFAFMTVEERVVDHLLSLASPAAEGYRPVARVTQQQIADGVGSAREVVARVLRALRIGGMIELSRGAVTVCDMEELLHRSAASATPRHGEAMISWPAAGELAYFRQVAAAT